MYMNQENKKHKIGIVGHTKGIGKAIAKLYQKKKYEVVGLSRSNGYDLIKDQEAIMEQLDDCQYIVVNAFAGKGQLDLLKKIFGQFHFHYKKVAVVTSTSGTPAGEDKDIKDKTYNQYCKFKKELIEYINELQQELVMRPLSVYDVCPDTVDTDMTNGLWEELPKLKADEVAEAVRYCFESTFNINKIVMQKNVS